jgi:simple sugar transport system substrate-binding protein
MAFMGQDFVATGYLIGQRMIADHGIGAGDLVFAPVEAPEAVYAVQRAEGLKMAMDEIGAVTEVVGVGFNLADAQTTEVQYLLGHPETVAIRLDRPADCTCRCK